MGVLLEELRARSSRDMAIKSWRSSASAINKKKIQKMKHFRLNVSCLPRSMSACVFAISQGHAATTDLTSSNAGHPLTLNSGKINIASVGMALRVAISQYTRGISYDTAELLSLIPAQSVPFFCSGFFAPHIFALASTVGVTCSTGLAASVDGASSVLQVSNSDPARGLFQSPVHCPQSRSRRTGDRTVRIPDSGVDDVNTPDPTKVPIRPAVFCS